MRIRSAAVLGAGTMGAQIAAHLANAGVPSLLLDVSLDAARQGLKRAQALKPDPFFTRSTPALIRTGSLDDLSGLRSCDWIIEAVVERLDVKQALIERVEREASATAIVSSNTSGIPISRIAEGRSAAFRKRWLGTHFFNPPRYLPLLEVIPTADTDADVLRTVIEFADRRLGKGVVVAKDTPGFIANRLGIYGLMQVFKAMEAAGLTVAEVDAITGPAIGRPKSATFRTMDLAGIDILAAVARDLATQARCRRAAGLRPSSCRRAAGRPRLARRQVRTRLLPEDGDRRDPGARLSAHGIPAVGAAALPVDRCGAEHRRARPAHPRVVRRQGQGRRVPARHAGANAALRRPHRRRGRRLARRRRSRDALGLRMGARPVRDAARHRRRCGRLPRSATTPRPRHAIF